jgi:DNA-binding winged helix-turn-helix (wHTH) protein
MHYFGEYSFDPRTSELLLHGAPVALERQPGIVLGRLLAAQGGTVTREELADAVWGADGTHVAVDAGLNYCIRQIRVALRDDPRAPRFLATIPRRGYRFIAEVTTGASRVPPRRQRWVWWTAAMAAAAVLLVTIETRPNNHHAFAKTLLLAAHDLVF